MARVRRRRFIQTLAVAAPAVATVAAPAAGAAQQVPAAPAGAPAQPGAEAAQPLASAMTVPDAVGDPVPAFFTGPQFAALRRLAGILAPATGGNPGAIEARAAEFLDFLLSRAPAARQQVYRAGLDALNTQARRRFGRPYAELETAQAETLLAPLNGTWAYDPPDPLTKFLRTARQDLRTATQNSWEVAQSTGPRLVNYMQPS